MAFRSSGFRTQRCASARSQVPICVRTFPGMKQGVCGHLELISRRSCLTALSSRDNIRVTRSMFTRICSYHQVMADYLDFISVFGTKVHDTDLRFSGFREQVRIARSSSTLGLKTMGRSGRQYHLSYNLKAAVRKSGLSPDKQAQNWTVRQVAVNHQFDITEGTTLWLLTQAVGEEAEYDLRMKIKTMMDPTNRAEDRRFETKEDCFRTSLNYHLLYCHWATEGWRWYIQYLEDRLVSVSTYPSSFIERANWLVLDRKCNPRHTGSRTRAYFSSF